MAELAFGPDRSWDDPTVLRAWLEQNEVPERDARAIERDGIEPLLVYRRLARANLREALGATIPRTVARLGSVFDEYFANYLDAHGPRTRYLRDVTPDFLEFCADAWASDPRVPGYVLDLARHEAVQIDVGARESRALEREPEELSLDAPVRFVEAVRLMRYDHAVHLLSEDEADRTAPVREPTALLVYRSPEHEVHYLELTPTAASILERLLAGDPLARSIQGAAEEAGTPLSQNLLEATARLLSDLAERGALLGKEPS
jgi:hypothetical protein